MVVWLETHMFWKFKKAFSQQTNPFTRKTVARGTFSDGFKNVLSTTNWHLLWALVIYFFKD